LKLEFILLGLINLHPSISGYELKTIINKSTGYFFTAALSQIYPALKAMYNQGLITYEIEPLVGKQDRKVYSITPDGMQMLRSWLLEPLALDPSLSAFQHFLLNLTFIGILDDESILSYLNAGLSHFRTEKQRLIENNLANEKEYIKMAPSLEKRYFLLWSCENEFLADDLDRKVRWIESLIESIRTKGFLEVS